VAEAAGLREDIYTADLVGIGCAAALPALRTADNYLQNHPGHRVIVLCAEVSSAALSWGDRIDLILSNCIFADGAAACLLSRRDPGPGFEIGKFESILWPQYRDDLRFEHAHSRLSNVISPRVPEVAALAVRNLFERISKKEGGGFRHFAFHPGGRKVLDGIRAALDLTAEDMEPSRAVLRDYGNMSSPSVLYVLKNILEERSPKQGDSLLLFSFGAGFSAFAASLAFAGAGGLAVAGADKRADAGVDV
jgi:alkylresorcinol/alkylpyrone synthase